MFSGQQETDEDPKMLQIYVVEFYSSQYLKSFFQVNKHKDVGTIERYRRELKS